MCQWGGGGVSREGRGMGRVLVTMSGDDHVYIFFRFHDHLLATIPLCT